MIPRFPYLTDEGTTCKGCGRLIAAYAGKHLVEAEYVDLHFKMEHEDGSFSEHTTPMCRDCAERVSLSDAEDLYLTDLAEWARQNIGNSRSDTRDWLRQQIKRIPVEVLGCPTK
jgi:hypothetical protein